LQGVCSAQASLLAAECSWACRGAKPRGWQRSAGSVPRAPLSLSRRGDEPSSCRSRRSRSAGAPIGPTQRPARRRVGSAARGGGRLVPARCVEPLRTSKPPLVPAPSLLAARLEAEHVPRPAALLLLHRRPRAASAPTLVRAMAAMTLSGCAARPLWSTPPRQGRLEAPRRARLA
jgi:hypothetical protein